MEKSYLTPEEEIECIEKRDDIFYKSKLFKAYSRQVESAARKYLRTSSISQESFYDLIQEGNLGLEEALKRFDLKRGCIFSTLARWWIMYKMGTHVFEYSRPFSITASAMKNMKKINVATEDMTRELERTPTPEEISQRMQMKAGKFELFKGLSSPLSSIDITELEAKDGQHKFPHAYLRDDRNDPREAALRNSGVDYIKERIKDLTPVQEYVIVHRYGLNGYREKTLLNISKALKISVERVRQIQNEAEGRLKKWLKN
jgi:RNA polymerase sigma factor (sigma-70 family)